MCDRRSRGRGNSAWITVTILVVIGAGSGGLAAAPFAARLGARVALVERDRPGGDCLYTGCVPSKTLLRVARLAHEARHADAFGLAACDPAVALARVMAHVWTTIERVYAFENPQRLAAAVSTIATGQHASSIPGHSP